MKNLFLVPLLAFSFLAHAEVGIRLPPVLNTNTVPDELLRSFPSDDGKTAILAVKVHADTDENPYSFFNNELWKEQVDAVKIASSVPTEPEIQYAWIFCNMNKREFNLACVNHAELALVAKDKPWWVPFATVPTESLSDSLALLTGTTMLIEKSSEPRMPYVNEYVNGVEPTPSSTQRILWDDTPVKLPIIWD